MVAGLMVAHGLKSSSGSRCVQIDIHQAIQQRTELMQQVSRFVHSHPELGYEEYQCSDYLVGVLEQLGMDVIRPVAGIRTAFRSTLKGTTKDGPRVGLVMLYDAVPAVGEDGAYIPNHSCGHNVISGAVVGAVAALSQGPRRGELTVIGMSGDEIGAPMVAQHGGSKALTAAVGEWDEFDAVLYAHPEFNNTVSHVSRWMERYRLSLHHPRGFKQRGELQGSVPWAVQALLQVVRSMEESDTQEFVMIKDLWMSGDVEADCKVNAQMQVLLFGLTQADVTQRATRLRQAVEAVGDGSQIVVELEQIGDPYMGVNPNPTLTSVVHQAMRDSGLEVLFDPEPLPFATDFGNISYRAPSVLIGIGREGGWQFHGSEGDREFNSSDGNRVMMATAEVLARTTMRLWEEPELVGRARREFDERLR